MSGMFFPYYLSWVSVAFIGYIFLSYNYGLLNQFLRALGQEPVNFYTKAPAWIYIIPGVNLWKNLAVNVPCITRRSWASTPPTARPR